MLVLGRKLNDRITLTRGDLIITLIVTDIDRGKVRIGIEAPNDVVILRTELLEEEDAQDTRR